MDESTFKNELKNACEKTFHPYCDVRGLFDLLKIVDSPEHKSEITSKLYAAGSDMSGNYSGLRGSVHTAGETRYVNGRKLWVYRPHMPASMITCSQQISEPIQEKNLRPLYDILKSEEEPLELKKRAAIALGEWGTEKTVEELSRVLEDISQPKELHQRIAEALRIIGGPRAVASLQKAVLDVRIPRATRVSTLNCLEELTMGCIWDLYDNGMDRIIGPVKLSKSIFAFFEKLEQHEFLGGFLSFLSTTGARRE